MPARKQFVPPGGFAGLGQQTLAVQTMVQGAATPTRRRKKRTTKKRVTKRRTTTRRKTTARKKTGGRLVKGSAAAKRRMAQLRKMRGKGKR